MMDSSQTLYDVAHHILYHYDTMNNWVNFGYDQIFKVTEKMSLDKIIVY